MGDSRFASVFAKLLPLIFYFYCYFLSLLFIAVFYLLSPLLLFAVFISAV